MKISALNTLYGIDEIHDPKVDLIHETEQEPLSFHVKQSLNFSENIEAEIIPSWEAPIHIDGRNNRDCRPRLKDGTGVTYLLDTGSMCCVLPAQVGDKIDKSVRLKTVDGSPFDCYGTKTLAIKMGRKQYSIPAVIARVKSPILGFDFVDKYKLISVTGSPAVVAKGPKKSSNSCYPRSVEIS